MSDVHPTDDALFLRAAEMRGSLEAAYHLTADQNRAFYERSRWCGVVGDTLEYPNAMLTALLVGVLLVGCGSSAAGGSYVGSGCAATGQHLAAGTWAKLALVSVSVMTLTAAGTARSLQRFYEGAREPYQEAAARGQQLEVEARRMYVDILSRAVLTPAQRANLHMQLTRLENEVARFEKSHAVPLTMPLPLELTEQEQEQPAWMRRSGCLSQRRADYAKEVVGIEIKSSIERA
jgi:hypothetical protein